MFIRSHIFMVEKLDEESIESSTTPDPGHRMGKGQIHKKTAHTGEPRGQPILTGDHKAVLFD